MSATSGGGGSVSEGSEAGGSSQSTMSVSDSPSTSFQANLAADNVTKITLSEENSAGGFAADMTGSKVNLTLDDRQQDGIVNVAFDYEEGGNRVSGSGGAGDGFKSMNGSEKKDKVPEAVNLELVNMVPYSNGNGTSYGVPVNGIPGIPMKKDSEQVDMGTPYDEYFVPVNEHKKYMRGEKLYVTKDKRRPTSWRRCLSWVVACTVISVVLIVAILAGTGVILSQEPNLVKDASVGRNFAGSNLKPSVTEKSLTPTAEKLMYVPRSIESEFVIDNLDFDPALRDLNSSAYQQFTSTMEDQLKMFLFDKETLESGASDVGIKVVNISHDPFKVNYRIGWNYKQGVNNPPEPIKMEDVKRRLVESLARNQGYIDKYHIDREAIKVDHVINACQMENGGCSHICYYNYITQQFTCTCPTHLVLDSTGKNCVAWAGPSEDDAVPIPSHGAYPGMPYESTANPVQDYEYSEGFQTGVHQGVRHHGHDSAGSDYKIPNDQKHGDREPTAEPSPEPTGEPASNQQDKSSAEFDVKSESISKLDGQETYNKEHDYHTTVTSGVNTQYEHGQSDIHSYQEATGPEAGPEPTAEPTPEDKYHDYAVHSVYGSEKSEPEPSPEPGLESTASKDHDHTAHSSYESKNHEPAAEPTPEPASEPTAEPSFEGKNYGHSIHESKDHEPAAELSPGRDDHDHIVLSVHELKDHEPSAEPTPEPAPEPTAEINTEGKDHAVHSLYDSKDHEPSAEPTPEPAPEPNTEDKNHAMHTLSESEGHEPAAEPTPEPGPEPVTESNGNGKDQEGHSSYKSGDHEPSAEPTPEPVVESTVKTNTDDKSHATHTLYEPKDKHIIETAAEVNPQNQDKEHGTHFVPVNEEKMESNTERAAFEDSEKARNTHSTYAFNDKESERHSTVDSTSEEKNKEQGSHSTYNTTGATSEEVGEPHQHLVHGHSSADHGDIQTKEHSQKVSSESIYNEHQTQMTTTRGSDHVESTSHSQSPEGDRNLKPGFSIRESSQELTPREGQMQVTEFKTEQRNETHSSTSRPQEENKSGHHTVPYLQDVLIKKPDSDFSENNGTYLEQNVERTASGEPVIEEVIIGKPGTKEHNNTETSPAVTAGFQTPLGNESDRSNSTPPEALSDAKTAVNGSQSGNSTDGSSFLYRQFSETSANNGIKISPSMDTESSTNGPINFEHSTTSISGFYSNETGVVENSQNPENAKGNSESTTTTVDQHSTGSFNTETNSFGFNSMPFNSENKTNLENKSIHSSQSNMPDVATQPTIQNEYHTIPVAVEFSGSAENRQNTDENSKREKHGDEPESNTRLEEFQTTLSHGEESAEVTKHPKADTVFSSGESDQTKVHEMTTESHVSITTILSVLPPNTAEQKMNSQTKENEQKLKEGPPDNKTMNEHSQPETNETTKLPEEFSNNIKDELLDNEEFNTLIDKEYKNREDSSTDGKEVLNKYPSKAQKIDKKKVKDYVKGEKVDSEKKVEVTVRPGVTPEDYILQKHVNGNENTFDLEYSLQNEHTTKHDGEVTVIDPHGLDGVPGVSFKPHGINNHDIKVLQTIAPDFRTENIQNHDLELQKPDSKIRLLDGKEGEPKQDKDYPKFDKDYKYEKQKVSKKKDLKKKGGSGKDGKNVELDEGRKYFTEFSKEDVETNPEVFKDFSETTMNPSFEKITTISEAGMKIMSGSATETTTLPEYKVKIDSTPQLSHTNTFEQKTEGTSGITQPSGQPQSMSEETSIAIAPVSTEQLPKSDQHGTSVDQNYHQIIDEPSVKTTSNVPPGTVYDGQPPESINSRDSETTHAIINTSGLKPNTESGNGNTGNGNATPGTVFDGVSGDATIHGSVSSPGFESSGSTIGEPGQINSFAVPTLVTNEGTTVESGIYKNTTANPTIIIHGQSGSLQDGHTTRFGNLTFYTSGNATLISALNGTLNNSDSHVFTFANHTTFPNGSVVQPTIIVRGQSGTLQDGHEIKFGNATFVTSLPNEHLVFKNSEVYKIQNGSLPGSVFDGHINSQDNQYYSFSNTTGTFVYLNTTDKQPAFIIKGESGDFGNARAYIMSNDSGSAFSRDFTAPSVIFRNSTVFAVGNTPVGDSSTGNIHEITAAPQDVTSNDTIHYTHQVSPKFFSTGTAYKVNNYFGYISKCAAGQFQCVNGTSKRGSACISLSSKCDSINDCSDGSDELGCIENGCPGNFQCSDGSCLKRNLVCNGILDCNDGSDEKQCESWKCEFDEFQCPSGRCIPVVWQCDGKPDCDNHTDEYNCQTSCGNDEYLCPEGWCVPLTYRCNGVKECSNGEDEQLCDCPHEEFKCQTGGCVSMKQVCDGLDDCPDRSDEWDCVKLEPGTNLLKIRTAAGNYEPVCADDWTSQYSDEVCTSLGYYSSVPVDNENKSSIMTETSFFALKNGSTGNLNKKIIVNLEKSERNCTSGKMVEIACQEFTCGSRSMTDSSSVEARLVGGMGATAGQWPSVALVYNTRNFHSCTANVLTPRWVLASYNCLKMGNKNLNVQDWKFFGGSTVFEAERENAETRKIVSIIPHPQVKFNQFLFSNDLALVELEQSLQFSTNLGAVCLPEEEMQPRQICVTAGWGMNSPEDKFIRQQLQYLPVPTMNLTECNSTEHYSGFITDDKICAGYNSAQKSLCYNEEGAPLMCVNDKGEWELQGVLSYHSNCGQGSHPSIFSSITPVKDWIKKTIGNAFERKAVTVTKR